MSTIGSWVFLSDALEGKKRSTGGNHQSSNKLLTHIQLYRVHITKGGNKTHNRNDDRY